MNRFLPILATIVLVTMSFSLGATSYALTQAPPAPVGDPWQVNDDDTDEIHDNRGNANTVNVSVTNSGADHSIYVVIRDSEGKKVGGTEDGLESPDSWSGTCPPGGWVEITDKNDTDNHKGSGTYRIS